MPNINLATEDITKKNPNAMGTGLIVSIVILILVFVLYGALLITNRVLSSKIEGVKGEYDIEYNKFLAGNGNEIIDFKNRSDAAEKIIAENKSMADVLSQVEKSMLPAVYLTSFKYDKSKQTISLNCIGDSFQTVAKQILSFKQNNYFSGVIPGRSSISGKENNKISFSIDLIIK